MSLSISFSKDFGACLSLHTRKSVEQLTLQSREKGRQSVTSEVGRQEVDQATTAPESRLASSPAKPFINRVHPDESES